MIEELWECSTTWSTAHLTFRQHVYDKAFFRCLNQYNTLNSQIIIFTYRKRERERKTKLK